MIEAVVFWFAVTFPNTCLGQPTTDELCGQVFVPGFYEVVIRYDGVNKQYGRQVYGRRCPGERVTKGSDRSDCREARIGYIGTNE